MKKITLLFTLFISMSAVSQTVYRLIERESFRYESDAWVQNGETTYQYANEGIKPTLELFQNVDNGVFTDFSRELKDYNANNLIIEEIREIKNGSNWDKDTRKAYTYTGEGDIQQILAQIANGTSWEDQYKFEFDYPDDNTTVQKSYRYLNNTWSILDEETRIINASTWLQIFKSSVNGILVNSARIETFYQNETIEERITEVWDESVTPANWVNASRYKAFFNTGGDIERTENYVWNPGLSPASWQVSSKVLYTWSTSNPQKVQVYQVCVNETCINDKRESIFNYPDGSLHIKATDEWDPTMGSSGDWKPKSETIYEYDSNGNWAKITHKGTSFLNPDAGLNFTTERRYYYEEGSTFSVTFNSLMSTLPYPNPTTDVINLTFKNPMARSSAITLYDIQGKLVHTNLIEKGASTHKIPVAYQAKGIYMLHLNTGEAVEVYKIVKND